ncbi:MAG TPA: RsmD family RNA methyltransferase [Pseudothermotoga sp.]|nr:RsmD family RNA methyltransferase [Pseudothermotoga sp.]HPP69602.1 RsmD family RNA methyltransferase [Pseudothermotoga sp.]
MKWLVKTGGTFKGRELKTVADKRTRYTTSLVRQAIFNIIDVSEKSFLELFCGSAIVSFEAISRGAKNVVAVDISRKSVSTVIENSRKLGVKINVVNSDFRRFLNSCIDSFDIVFADTPYNMGFVKILRHRTHLFGKKTKRLDLCQCTISHSSRILVGAFHYI